MIRKCVDSDVEIIYGIINEAARAYKGVIPAIHWKEPYMSRNELRQEMEQGVIFWCYEKQDDILGVMGLQEFLDAALIRHAYVRTDKQKKGIGSALLSHLKKQTSKPILVGIWMAAFWAVSFYKKNGFRLAPNEMKDELFAKYWRVPKTQIINSTVLWYASGKGDIW